MRRTCRLSGACVVAALLSSGSASAQHESTVTTLNAASPVTAYNGTLVWSAFDPTTQRYRLRVADAAGRGETVGASRAVPFDADLGPGPNGKPTLVYSRCKREPPHDPNSGSVPAYSGAEGCSLRIRAIGGKERRLRLRLPAGTSAMLPAIWRQHVAFAWEVTPGRFRIGWIALKQGARSYPVHAIVRRGWPAGGEPSQIDLRGTQVAFDWSFIDETRCEGNDGAGLQIWLAELAKADARRADEACEATTRSVSYPSLGPRSVWYLRETTEIVEADRRSGRALRAFRVQPLVSLTYDGNALFGVGTSPDARPPLLRIQPG